MFNLRKNIWNFSAIIFGLINCCEATEQQNNSQITLSQPPTEVQSGTIDIHNEHPNEPTLDMVITFYNVGRGNCVLVENFKEGKVALVDCGSMESSQHNRNSLQAPNVNINAVYTELVNKANQYSIYNFFPFLSHADSDHTNIMSNLFLTFPYNQEDWLRNTFVPSSAIEEGYSFFQQANKLVGKNTTALINEVISKEHYPQWMVPLWANEGDKNNSKSLVLKVVGPNGCSAILPGDADDRTISSLINHLKTSKNPDISLLKTTIMLAPHHGSVSINTKVNWSKKFMEAANPSAVIVSSGAGGNVKTPNNRAVEMFRNATNGKITQTHAHNFIRYDDKANPLDNKEEELVNNGNEQSPIFNTLSSGNVVVYFYSDSTFYIATETEGRVITFGRCNAEPITPPLNNSIIEDNNSIIEKDRRDNFKHTYNKEDSRENRKKILNDIKKQRKNNKLKEKRGYENTNNKN